MRACTRLQVQAKVRASSAYRDPRLYTKKDNRGISVSLLRELVDAFRGESLDELLTGRNSAAFTAGRW